MFRRLCFILVVVATIHATNVRKKSHTKERRQTYFNGNTWYAPVDVEFVLDSSNTVGKDNFQMMIRYVQDLVRHWQIGPSQTQVGVITYGNGAHNQFFLNGYQTEGQLMNALSNIQYSGGQADLGPAMNFAYSTAFSMQHGARDHVPHIVIHVGNGVASNSQMALQEAQKARDNGVAIYNVVVGNGGNKDLVSKLGTDPQAKYQLHADNFPALSTLVTPLASRVSSELPLSNTKLPAPNSCLQKADLVFMLDSSSSVDSAEYQQLENFLKNFIVKLPVGPNNVQIGLEQYSSFPSMEFPLSMYSDRMDVLKAVDTLKYMGGGTNTADALKYLREHAFSKASGARTDVPRIGIVITDGHSSNPTETTKEADNARNSNIGLIGVGVGPEVDLNELNSIVDQPHSSNAFALSSFSQLESAIPRILQAACNVHRSMPANTGSQTSQHGPDSCQDKIDNCNMYEATACKQYGQWAKENCARHCGICTPKYTDAPPVCKDAIDNCHSFQADMCTAFGAWAHINCRQFCGFCPQTSSTGFFGQCFYKGKTYKTGEKWDDGCDYECTCEDGNAGKYRCYNKCPVYNDLPATCTLVVTPGQCCLKPVCNFQQKVTTTTGSGVGKTQTGISVCVYGGKQYYQDQSWEVGCDYKCTCINANQGVYNCQSYCPRYSNLPGSCRLTKQPGECCEKPTCDFNQQIGSFVGSGSTTGIGSSTKPKTPSKCEDVLTNCNMYEDTSCKAPYLDWAKNNCKKRCNLCDDGKAKPGPTDVCFYQGKSYHQGETWKVSCDMDCACEQAAYGYYRCTKKCPTYNNLPIGCYTKKKAGDCCETVVCDRGTYIPSTTNLQSIGSGGGITVTGPGGQPINVVPTLPSGQTPQPGTGGTGMTAPRLNGCLYNGNIYVQGQQWEDGCSQVCVCTDAATGLYKCRQRCPTYQGVPQNCLQKADPNDHCCTVPACNPLPGQVPIPVYGQTTQNIGAVQPPTVNELMTGQFTVKQTLNFQGGTIAPPTAPSNPPTGPGIGYCEYKGKHYTQSQSWEDGCDYNCVCQDATIGRWLCNDKCPKYENIPKPYCMLVQDPANLCCKKPHCDFTGSLGQLVGSVSRPAYTQPPTTKYPGTLPPITTPKPAFCVYKGQNYVQGQQWYDACDLSCTCEDAKSGIYRCTERCPSYPKLPGCTETVDPKDPQCCKIPSCPQPTQTTGGFPTLPPGILTNQHVPGKPTNVGYCEYNGQRYKQGDKWADGCKYDCECQDANAGLYRCTEKCARFASLPPQCKLVSDFTNPCCTKPSCDFTSTSGSHSGQGHQTPPPGYITPSPGYTGTPIPAFCVYHGAKYYQGQTWNDGCDKKCRCEDSVKGLYVCDDRCPKYDNIPPQCSMVADPKDQCCRMPSCQFIPVTGQITGTLAPNMIPTAVPGKITGQLPTPTPGPDGKTPTPLNMCVYKGKMYSQGQQWEDGCDYHCVCDNAGTGKYTCTEKCARYTNLPPQCQLQKDPSNPCCDKPSCDFTGTGGHVTGQATPNPSQGATPVPNTHITPTPGMPKSVCVYKGKQYTQGQNWYDGCDYKCVCEDADQGVYRCDSRCPSYGALPKECHMEADPKDPFCCKMPKCTFNPTSGHITGQQPPTFKPGTITGGVVKPTLPSGQTPVPHTGQTPMPKNVCVYKGKDYQTGQQWQDGCDYNCVCEDGMTGKYKCTEQCARYDSLPPQCTLVQDTLNPCCKKPYCNFNPSTGSVGGVGSTPAPTGPTPKMCVYNGVAYKQGQTWNDGCQLKCTCEDSMSGVYRCDERCARYDQVPAGCVMTTDPRDSCCRVPKCTPVLNPNPSVGPSPQPGVNPTPNPYLYPTAAPGKITGQTVTKPNTNTPTNTTTCVYHGVSYKQGQKWQDGCDYECECVDMHLGKYVCKERCAQYISPPPYCVMGVDPQDQCCRKPICNPLVGPTPSPGVTQAPSPGTNVTPNPNNTPAPQPKNVCVYKGNQYVQGQQWYDDCDKKCICENGMTGFYRCSDRCASYPSVPSGCRMVPDPKDPQCCQVPECLPTPGPNGYQTPKPGVNPTPSIVTNVPGVVTGIAPVATPTPGPGGQTPVPKQACVYKGREYKQGERWQDGCDYNCICEDGMTGKYKCDERCAKYPYVPPECKLTRDTVDFCCYKMACDFGKPTPNPYVTPSPQPGQTPNPNQTPQPKSSYCMYKGAAYRQGQEWSEGCLKKCRCDDADNNIYTCSDRCPTYQIPPGSSCTQQVDPSDPCCRVPHCVQNPTPNPFVNPSANPNQKPTPNPYPQPTIIPHGTIGGKNPNKNPLTNQGFCVYKNIRYKQGDKWQDGCDYNCECIDEKDGQYTCTQRCNKVLSLPAKCTLHQDPYDTCCKTPNCPVVNPATTVKPNPFATQQPTPNPNVTPKPKNVCTYMGKTYTKGQQWYDGCQKKCVCVDDMSGYYTCTDRCPVYKNVAPKCIMVPDPKDPACCQAPQCDQQPHKPPTGVQGSITGYGKPPTPSPQPQVTPNPLTGQTPVPQTQSTPPPVCVYKGKMYKPGQRWADGCDYTCVCEDGMSGKYTCTETCPKYPNLAPNCRMVADFANPCCQKPDCTPLPGTTVKPAPGQTPVPKSSFCVYKGVPIPQGQSIKIGCDKVCRCEDSMTGQVNCDDRCATYPPLKQGCTLVTDPNDNCCQVPKCTTPNTNGPQHILKGVPGSFTGQSLPPTNPNPLTKTTGCMYHGRIYNQGQTWDDGCSYYCECLDDHTGKYKCNEKCAKLPYLPAGCSLMQDTNDKCCEVAYCPNLNPTPSPTHTPIGGTPMPVGTPYLGPTPYPIGYVPYPGATPYPGPSKYPIGSIPFPGGTPYLGPTPYPIGYVPHPGATPYPGPSKYPFYYTPYPGATPYLGPTPYPIGYTPSPGATPYPGPSRYPIGYTPSPGATPYLGPTPYPIGYTPWPGATPYPGPSRYPIGSIPFPGGTPYLGPTPYPIGYVPHPGATPYPGPSKYPIGYTPSPGATPYLGPTPYPLGYTAVPHGTPYPGPSKYPIGYTPSPGATPYLGPTPYPIGFVPFPGGTPYYGPTPYPIGYTPSPGATPYPGPSRYPIGYTPSPGATPYLGPTPWPIGYTPWPYATPYPGPSKYPIGYTPSPGATPYLGPTPYPIGYVPFPGATPYPGPSKYPIGYTPSPGATPYLGPTPWPVGYTPSPGATPYPGPSKYPIYYTPYPGATPYLGPTPYPIGYTPFPGATPYPGPSKYPIGSIPFPGGTPYAGPTPYPIGYTPSPGATPYAGRTPWPIGYTPSPHATPYAGPTKYPIGYTPSPGATPYLGPTPYPIGFVPYPGATPYPGPSKFPIFYTPSPGATPYLGPTPWPIGYTPSPGATPYPGPNKYPIYYTPFPGATPYLGPTPYPIGYTPFPGATPYPGPSKYPIGSIPYPGGTPYLGPTPYPIGFTPSPGATPYLGPTPYPIGFTPYPGATPYPGPSKYPIGSIPFPGGTPYYGPTPYPIGYTPFPGATPYPGPSKYPIGSIPFPGGTPYYGPTPYPIGYTPSPGATPYAGPSKMPIGYTPWPGATPYLGPTPWPIGYTPSPGATPYPGPTRYPIGYIPYPGATPYAGPTVYPLGYTPSPGATPYFGPTPYPIGYTPWPGATPYPGPGKYPIGYTPSPGATPYLGPTPYPIGFTPFPGATPYPGPSRYPIGYTPSPGATPYAGPTPYPIGYTPSPGATPYPGRTISPNFTPYPIGVTPWPGATPYPGPSKWPIGYVPYPGATPYLGPTPYPIGFTPFPGATPYPGPSKYPIGYTPSPGATPYLGPTPYPIGYTPWPGATPYPGPTLPPGFTLQPTPGPKPPQGMCVYKNQYYREKQVWYDDCDKICRCESALTQDIRCQERCAKYPNMASNCILMPDPKDPSCCEIPSCPLVAPGATPTPGFIQVTGSPGVITGQGPVVTPTPGPSGFGFYTPVPNPSATPQPKSKGCIYKGVIHSKGDKWNDGCDYQCTCLDDMTGQYSCTERCLRIPKLDPRCVMLQDPKDQCCKKPYCDFLNPTPFPGGIPTPNPALNPSLAPGQTTPNSPFHNPGTNTGFCVYKGSFYRQGDQWNDGCQKTCTCDDAMHQKYRCNERCKSFGSMPAGCIMNTDPKDSCCLVPDCTKLPLVPVPVNPGTGVTITGTNPPGVTPWYGPGTSGYVTPKAIGGTFTGTSGNGPNQLNPHTGSGISGYGGVCVYNGKTYHQNDKWDDGCKLQCECVDALRGNYRCNDRCPAYFFLPPQCVMVEDPKDKCCKQARCSPAAFPTPAPGTFVTPTPAKTVNPNQITPTNGGGFGGSGQPVTVSPSYGSITNNPKITPNHGTGFGGSQTPPHPSSTFNYQTGTRPPNMCRFTDGTLHAKGTQWNNGCKETCTCDDPVQNNIICNKRCPTYSAMPSFCQMQPDPQDNCCKKPVCNYQGTNLVPMIGNKQPTTSPTLTPSVTNVVPLGTHSIFSGSGQPPNVQFPTSMGGRDVCIYKGVMHKPGESWDDGCKFTCTCQPNGHGRYQCTDKCPAYPPLPSYCKFIQVAGQCCPSLNCDIPKVGNYHPVPQVNPRPNPQLAPGQQPTPQPTNSPQTILAPGQANVFGGSGQPGHGAMVPTNPQIVSGINDKCIYKGKMYNQGEKWDDGCDFSCECVEARSGFFKCLPKCPTYTANSLPKGCYTTKAQGQCCDVPMCTKPDGSTVNPLTHPGVYPVYGSFSGGFTGFRPNYTPNINNVFGGSANRCIYKGISHAQGSSWTDGCDFDCNCIDATKGQYRCQPKCPTYTKLPSMCRSVNVPGDCCARVTCDTQHTSTTPAPQTGPCQDVLPNCQLYNDDSCKAPYLDWAEKNCKRRCGLCPQGTTPFAGCKDKLDNCAAYGKSSCTGQFAQWAKVNCMKYCDLCPMTTTPVSPQSGCQDKLPNCKDYGIYACSGQYEQWAKENCKNTCGYCPGSGPVTTTLAPGVGIPQTGWTILMKGVAGVPGDLYQLWASPNVANPNVPSAMYLTSTFPGNYKPDLSNHWSECSFDKVKVGIFNKGVEKANIVFNAQGADKMSWFDPSRIISSTWTDLKYAPKNIFSMMGDTLTGREFYASNGGSGCSASGWMMISTRPGCSYEAGSKPAFYYVPGTTQASFGQTQLKSGDVFAILAQGGNCNGQSTKPAVTGFVTSSNFCVYKNKFYNQGENWVDGCDYNCTCEDATSGFYRCRDLCPTYNNLPNGCKMVKQPGECCAKPDCGTQGGATCYYKGKNYKQDETWDDGCDYKCTCVDASRGFYQCKTKCLQWQLPAACSLLTPPAGKCCPVPHCPQGYTINYPPNYVQE